MAPFRDNVFYLLLWRAILATLIGVVLMATSEVALGPALLVGAHVALLFALGLMIWSSRLNDDRVVRVRAWQMLASDERPAGPGGRHWACTYLKEIELRFAEVGAIAAIVLGASALVVAGE